MMDALPKAEQALMLDALARRAKRLESFVRLGAPMVIIADATLQVVKTAMVLCGGAITQQFMGWVADHLRDDAGLCRFCGRAKDDVQESMCPTCREEMAQEDRELLLQESDDGNPH